MWFEFSDGTHYQAGAVQMANEARALGQDVSMFLEPLPNVSLTEFLNAASF